MGKFDTVEGGPLAIDDRLSQNARATLNNVAAMVEAKTPDEIRLLTNARREETVLLHKMQAVDKDFDRFRDTKPNMGSLTDKIAEFKKDHPEQGTLADGYVDSVRRLEQARDALSAKAAPILKQFEKEWNAIDTEARKNPDIQWEGPKHTIGRDIIEGKIDARLKQEQENQGRGANVTTIESPRLAQEVARLADKGITSGRT